MPALSAGKRGEAAPPPLLQLKDIRKSFGSVRALLGVDLQVLPGEVVALMGDNGAGKSTLIKIMSGALEADSGEILIGGSRVSLTTPRAAMASGVATVYQDLALCDNLDVVANLFLGREHRLSSRPGLRRFLARAQMTAEARRVLGQLAITLPSLRAAVGTLSGGQRQAIAVARALLWGSKAVLFDEPTAALGTQQTSMVHSIIRQLRDCDIAVVVVSHNLEEVFGLADQIAVLRQGRLAGLFRPDETTPDAVFSAITGGNLAGLPGRKDAAS
ncbi:MAG: sugar ABC transporter ATP-binding protein [Chloroflexi bacterium]|nr:sugar ABC transporter ATP-binding protein [Chloroflexota bacterium]